ncbi:MAG: pentapeptide repeat-containing protein [Eubacteriaceae bacterium]|nr:pentapeptide repeat-containing protein [Eubacteriaceae bacterium]
MSVKKPNLYEDMEQVEDFSAVLANAREYEIDIKNCEITGVVSSGVDFSNIGFAGVVFRDCKFMGCDFSKASFVDDAFSGCDLSNSVFEEAYFNRCEFTNCKGAGASFNSTVIRDVSWTNCNFRYSIFNKAQFNNISIVYSDFCDAAFTESALGGFSAENAYFLGTNFFRSPLKGVDFTKCEIEGIVLSDSNYELRGAVVTSLQAVSLSKFLGIVIKDEQ